MATMDSGPHVLCINDTQEILDVLQGLLEAEGYRVTISLALLNLDKVKALAPDVIVQDIMFEHEQQAGWKFLTLSRLDPDVARIPLILCTGATLTVSEPRMAAQLDRMGVRVILKPFNLEDLLTALREVLAAERLIDQASDGDD
jgi:CheY-like chemotaxis protein